MTVRIFVGPTIGADAFPIGQAPDGAPILADSEGVATTIDITAAFAPKSFRFIHKP